VGVTLEQIAAKAGVSKATVSRVLNGLAVKYETEQMVKGVMEKMQYKPHRFARGLSNRRTGFLGVLSPSMELNVFVASVIAGMESEARRCGKLLTLGVLPEEGDVGKEVVRSMTDPPVVDGLLFFLPTKRTEPILRSLVRNHFPVVVICERNYEDLVSSVVIDNFDGAKQAVQYLVRKGHKRIGFIKGRTDHSDSTERFEGYRQALAEAGIPLDSSLILPGAYDIKSGMAAAGKFLRMKDRPSAVFASNDSMAIGLLHGLHTRKKEGAFAVIGFDDIELASLVTPSLTTIGYDLNEVGRQAVHKLTRLISGEEKNRSVLQIKANLIVRESA
jgi:DNA-binding LacI/PurR family transcriptional regulator